MDVFLSNHPYHDHAEAGRRTVPFAGVELPVLACADLAVFKAFFARPKDAVDVALMTDVGAIDLDDLEETVTALLGDPEERRGFFEADPGRPTEPRLSRCGGRSAQGGPEGLQAGFRVVQLG